MKKILTAAQKRKIERAQALLLEVKNEAFPEGWDSKNKDAYRVWDRLTDSIQAAGSSLKD